MRPSPATNVRRLEGASAVKRLQRAFGYYLDRGAWDEAADLFSVDGTIEFGLDGIFRGRQRVREYLCALGGGHVGLQYGQIHEYFQLQPVVRVSADGDSATGYWRTFLLAGQLGKSASWGEGPFESQYVRTDGVWEIRSLHWYPTFVVPYEGGWVKHPDMTGGRFTSLTPDLPPSTRCGVWPEVHTPPSPHLGAVEPISDTPADSELVRRIARLEDVAALENLVSGYGYCLDKQLWDALAELFTADATMEISQRGIYVGRQSIRRALELFGAQGIRSGTVHNHMQLQPVIHVADDGTHAWVRSRAFSQLGTYGGRGMWHGGVYENEFVKEDGVWKFKKDHVYTTYFAEYERGWRDGGLPAAQPSTALPPDAPPSEVYEAFPGVYIPPFHYRHPVTGAPSRQVEFENAPEALALVSRVQRLEDENAIENLQRSYGYYVDKALWKEAADLFAADGTLEIGGRGVFVGKSRILDYFTWLVPGGPTRGHLYDHMQLQPIVSVSAEGTSARGRWRFFAQAGVSGTSAIWGLGTYENEYVKERGVWKIQTLHAHFRMYTPYAEGWGKTALPITRPEKDLPPDRAPTAPLEHYPSTYAPPFHYPHPCGRGGGSSS